jgi:hypothetical protein
MKEKKLTQEQRVLKFLKSKRRYITIIELMDWGLMHYITEIKRILPRLAEQGLVESDFRGEKYKSWRIKK